MREIKFRAWNKVNQTMWYPWQILLPWGIMLPLDEASRYWNTTSQYIIVELELMQFTGLKDKNGKEIWEGDIVKLILGWNTEPIIAIVKFELGTFLMSYGNLGQYYTFGEHPEIREVIGNIWENKGLINV
jgi:uncharacterized phage protein (TIGR01671 family)